jgi:ankyrin repeat protein
VLPHWRRAIVDEWRYVEEYPLPCMTFWTKLWQGDAKPADLHQAVKEGKLEAVQKFVADGADVCKLDARGIPPLQTAAARGHLEIARLLIKNGADVNFVSEAGGTPLISAAAGLHPELIKLLIIHGAQPNRRGSDGRFPLICPFRPSVPDVERQIKSIRSLVANGARVNERTEDGGTPLMVAAGYGNREAAEELLRLGADATLRNARHESAAMRASKRGHDELAEMLRQQVG